MSFLPSMKKLREKSVRGTGEVQGELSPAPVLQEGDLFNSVQALTKNHSVRTIFDVGTNAGDFSYQFSQMYPDARIYCFEPSPGSYKAIEIRFGGNPRMNLNNIAVSDSEGSAEFYCYKANPTDSLLMPAAEWKQWVDGKGNALELEANIRVPTTSLDIFCQHNAISSIDILKIDTQGAERLILDGAKNLLLKHAVNIFILEMLFVPVYKNQPFFYEICEKMAGYGYSLVNFYNIRYDEGDLPLRIKWADGVFVYPG